MGLERVVGCGDIAKLWCEMNNDELKSIGESKERDWGDSETQFDDFSQLLGKDLLIGMPRKFKEF